MASVTDRHWIDGQVWASSTLEVSLFALCDDMGPRFSGTWQERKARGWLCARMRELGLDDVREEEFQYLGWSCQDAGMHAHVGSASPRPLWIAPHIYCPPANMDRAEAVYVGAGTRQEFQRMGDRIRGRLVLCDAVNWPPFRRGFESSPPQVSRAIEAGAAGFVSVSATRAAGPRVGTAPHAAGKPCAIPVAGVSLEDGEYLKRALRRGDRPTLSLRVSTHVGEATTANVVGEIRGGPANGLHLVLAAHYDGPPLGQGAIDNASGVAAVLETARILVQARDRLRCSVRVVCLAAEEVGLLGCQAYLQRHAGERDHILCMVNVDKARRPLGLMVQGSPSLLGDVKPLWAGLEPRLSITDVRNGSGDDDPFVRAGIPAIATMGDVGDLGECYEHTAADTLEKVDQQDLRATTSVLCTTLLHLAGQDNPPCVRLSPSELDEYLKRDTDRHYPFGK